MSKQQLNLPTIKEAKSQNKRRFPQPRVKHYRIVRKFEILHRPFDLKFRGRIGKWLEHAKRRGLNLAETLEADQVKIINLYFYPQEKPGKWLNQERVLRQTGLTSKRKLKKLLVTVLLDIWVRVR